MTKNSARVYLKRKKIFIMHCKLKNLAPYTIKYYEENLNFFQSSSPLIKNVDEISQDVIDSYPAGRRR